MDSLTRKSQERLGRLIRPDAVPPSPNPAPDSEATEAHFGQVAVRLGYVTPAQLEEVLQEQKQLAANGETMRVGQLLMRSKRISLPQFLEVLKVLKQGVLVCAACGKVYNISGQPAGTNLLCLNCGKDLGPPSDGAALLERRGGITPYQVPAYAPGEMRIGKYRLIREVARGGMGVVYEAEDTELKRHVALKLLQEGEASTGLVKRLHREAALAARLHHPNIITIHEVGAVRDPGMNLVHYICMEYVAGGTLQDAIIGRKMSLREGAAIVELIARAVDHAHREQIVHRDLKPANVLIDTDGRPVVTDFGLAVSDEADVSRMTRTGAVLGTPSYMAPEQVEGKRGEVDSKSDVYALGVVLYEVVTGGRPFEGDTAIEVYRRILEEEPKRPRSMNSKCDSDLETIILRAMARRKEDRYPSALAMAEDLKRYLSGEPITARAFSVFHYARLRLQKRLAVVVLSALLLSAVAVGGWMTWRSSRYTEALRIVAEADREITSLISRGGRTPAEVDEEAAHILGKLQAVSADYPDEAAVHLSLARVHHVLAQDEKIEAELKRVLEVDPGNPVAHYELARHYGNLLLTLPVERNDVTSEDQHAAAEEMQRLVRLKAEHIRAASQGARAGADVREEETISFLTARVADERDEVIRQATEVINRGGASARWYLLRADARNSVSVVDAIEDYRYAIDREPNNPYLLLSLASVLQRNDSRGRDPANLDRAIEVYQRFVARRPDWSHVHMLHAHLAHGLLLAGRANEGLSHADAALELRPEDPYLLYTRGRLRAVLKLNRAACEDLESSVAAEPRRGIAVLRLADVAIMEQRYADALTCLERAKGVVREQEQNELHHIRARVLLKMERTGEALEAVDLALRVDPGTVRGSVNAAHHFLRSEILSKLERYADAKKSLDTAITAYAPGRTFNSELLWIYLQRYDPEPEDYTLPLEVRYARLWARLFRLRGLMSEKLGETSAAQGDFKQAITLDPALVSELENRLGD